MIPSASLIALSGLVSSTASASSSFRIVAMTNDVAPGVGGVFLGFNDPQINELGQVAFGASVSGAIQNGVWIDDAGTLSLVIKRNDPFPGTNPPASFRSLSNSFKFTDTGVFGGEGNVNVTGPIQPFANAVFVFDAAGGAELIAYENQPLPAPNQALEFDRIFFAGSNASGDVAFVADLAGLGVNVNNDRTLWRSTSSGLELLEREGPPFDFQRLEFPVAISANASVAYPAGIPAPTQPDYGLYVDNLLTGRRTVALEGETAPGFGTSEYGSSDRFRNFSFNDASRVAFSGFRNGSVFDSGLWSDGDGNGVQLILRAGDQAPGIPMGVTFDGRIESGTGRAIRLNNAGDIVFGWKVEGPGINELNNNCLWRYADGVITLIAREGDHAPGTPTGTLFSGNFPRLSMNDNGRIAFQAGLRGTGVGIPNNQGFWGQNSDGDLILVARTGDFLDIDPDPMTVHAVGIDDVRLSQFGELNDQSEIAAFVSFLNGSQGVLVFDLDAPVRAFVADFDEDGDVDLGDFGIFGAAFGAALGDPNYSPRVDFDQDGDIDLGDFGIFGSEFGRVK